MMKTLTQYINEQLETNLSSKICDWYAEEYPDSPYVSELNPEATFSGIYDRITGQVPLENGEDAIYSYCDVYSAEFAEQALQKLSQFVAIPASELERQWKSNVPEDVRIVKDPNQ